jgi:type IV secretion system protein VirB5
LIAVAGLLIGLAGVAGIAYVGSKSKFVPYVIEVNKLGEAVPVGPAQVAGPADPRVGARPWRRSSRLRGW